MTKATQSRGELCMHYSRSPWRAPLVSIPYVEVIYSVNVCLGAWFTCGASPFSSCHFETPVQVSVHNSAILKKGHLTTRQIVMAPTTSFTSPLIYFPPSWSTSSPRSSISSLTPCILACTLSCFKWVLRLWDFWNTGPLQTKQRHHTYVDTINLCFYVGQLFDAKSIK